MGMLVLSRKEGEAVHAGTPDEVNNGGGLIIRVLGYERGEVRLGIEAGKHTLVLREELIKGGKRKVRG